MEYTLIKWPESQGLMDKSWFKECILMNDANQFDTIGYAAYFVPKQYADGYLKELEKKKNKKPKLQKT